MLIREWRKEDVEEIAVLEKECFSDPWTKEMLISSSLLSGFCGFVVEDNDKIVGYIGSTFIFEDSEVLLVAVKNSHRRKGLGKLLIETLTKKLKENDVEKIFLEVRKSNLPAINCYKTNGFVQIAERKQYYGDGEDAIIMEKLI